MAELKTKVNDGDVTDFINSVDNEQKRRDGFKLLEIFSRLTGQQPKMWGSSIIGFGQYHYKSEKSQQEGDWMLTGFSPRKFALTLYLMWVMAIIMISWNALASTKEVAVASTSTNLTMSTKLFWKT